MIPIAPNLYIALDPNFKEYNYNIVHELLKDIDINLSTAIGIEPFSTCPTFILYRNDNPKCSIIPGIGHLITISATNNYWGQWVYEFAHEYCHHLINGELTGEIKGLLWFEEVLCELSSMYNLYVIAKSWKESDNPIKKNNSPVFSDYLISHLRKINDFLHDSGVPTQLIKPPFALSHPTRHSHKTTSLRCSEFLREQLPTLHEEQYHRQIYSVVAACVLPLFLQNASLWKLILHIGDSRKWDTLPQLFDYLHSKADDSYAESLRSLETLLLG